MRGRRGCIREVHLIELENVMRRRKTRNPHCLLWLWLPQAVGITRGKECEVLLRGGRLNLYETDRVSEACTPAPITPDWPHIQMADTVQSGFSLYYVIQHSFRIPAFSFNLLDKFKKFLMYECVYVALSLLKLAPTYSHTCADTFIYYGLKLTLKIMHSESQIFSQSDSTYDAPRPWPGLALTFSVLLRRPKTNQLRCRWAPEEKGLEKGRKEKLKKIEMKKEGLMNLLKQN